ncbi:ABC-2 type transport system ATP-binding protein [Thermomonospora echinospora]|uniref:ABC-2 type transport system ATP-binding protein n=1 Tax=Thermomonospora echinospora TaxID=1992 RepID=A0A1H6D1L9_9ACTN|nr:ATP-binding cassette domain-containing protein [Thermomonospora echinospora]SEG78803.1 ABC-2 type transport system ATP-binding protein [Thermomonospora echinospora]
MNMIGGGGAAIRTRGLRKTYGAVEALRSLDITVDAGETFGFLGPNGAGKSTTIAMLCTLLRPTAGRAEVAGADVVRAPHDVRRRVGVVFQESTADNDLTAEENLRFHAELYGISRRESRRRADFLLDLLALSSRRKALVGTFSTGLKRRLEIARSLMHRPEVLFLDEPTAGLDPHSRALVWDHLHRLQQQQVITIFLTTHYLEEAEHCHRIAVVDGGGVIAEGSPQQLKAEVGSDVVHLQTADNAVAARSIRDRFGLNPALGPDGVRVHAANGAELVPRLCAASAVPVHSIMVTRPSLDDVFLHYTGRGVPGPPRWRDERAPLSAAPDGKGSK